MKHIFCLIIISTAIFGCGIRPGISSSNLPLPTTFAQRNVYPDDLAGGYSFQDITGGIIYIKKGMQPLLIGLIRPSNYVAEIIPIKESNAYYKSRITKEASAQGSYLAIAAGLSSEQMLEIEIIDIARSSIEFPTTTPFQEILTQAKSWVATHPKIDTASTRLWIKEVVLSRNITNGSSKIKANASGSVGPVAKIEGGIFNSSEIQNKSIQLGLVAFDIDKLVQQSSALEGITGTAIADQLKFAQEIGGYSEQAIKKQ